MAVAISRTANPAGAGTGTTITYSTQAIGVAANDRTVVVVVGTEVASASPNSATLNYGTGALPMRVGTVGNIGAVFTRIFWLNAPTGTTADVAITFGASVAAATHKIAIYRVTDGVVVAEGGVGDTDADPISSTAFQIPNGGGAIGVCADADAATARTWTGLTEDLDETTTAFRFSTGTSTTAGSTTITVSGGNNEDGALSWLVFMPSYVARPLSEPVRQAIRPALAIALGASGLFSPPMALPVNRTIALETGAYNISIADDITFSEDGESVDIGWMSPLSEPRRLPHGIGPHLRSQYTTQVLPQPAPQVDWWISPLSEPVRSIPKPTAAVQSTTAFTATVGASFSISLELGSYTISIADDITFSETNDISWFNHLADPARPRYNLSYLNQPYTTGIFQPQPAVQVDWWLTPFSEPVRKRPGLRPDLQQSLLANSFFPSGFYISLEAGSYVISIADDITFSGIDGTNFEWFRPLSEPVRRRPVTAHLYQYFNSSGFQQAAVNYSITLETGEYTITGEPSQFIFDNEGWRTAFSEPVRTKRGLQRYLQSPITAPVVSGTGDSASLNWLNALSEPVRKRVFGPHLQQPFTTDVTPLRTAGRLWWHSPWSEPQRHKRGLGAHLQRPFTTDAKPVSEAGRLWWLGQLSEPVRTKPRLGTHHHQTLAYVGAATQNAPNNNFAEQSYFSKYAYPWSEPVRQKPGLKPQLQQFYANDYELVPIPPEPRAYFLPLSEPVRKLEGLKWYLQQTTALPPRLLPTPDVTGVLDAVENNEDVALIGISVYDGGVPGATASAQVSIIEIQAGVSSGGVFTARVSVVEVPPETATATVSIIEIVAADGSVSIQEV
jgi:hypothetical protein